MIIQDLFVKDINRNINGVVKVSQDDEASIKQELSEYVVTRELQRHFADFFESYTAAIDTPTDRVGVWISGFFGSGKSHFLKMLSYLLANKKIAGQQPIDYFADKMIDPIVYSHMKRACEMPTEAILFNIDDKASNWKEGATAKTALLRAFGRVFYEHRGFCGSNLRTAQLEEHIDKQGKTAEFRDAFERIAGDSWLECRRRADFFADDVAEALQEVLGWSEQQARSQADSLVEDAAVAPEDLVDEIASYAEERAAANGGRFRLLFMVDEVGQFIGSDVNLMLNLQTLVEDLGARCQGKVWVMVTSQEAIDSITKVSGNDFSKIQGRFNTRLSLSSSSVDEVIKRRVLDKTDVASAMLKQQYDQQSAVLKNLYTFEETRADLVGYRSAQDFCESYPFVGYQFTLMRDVLKQIRLHGNSGKHLSGGERSMLSGFQESAQAVEAQETGVLVPLWRFYDTLAEFLEHDIRQVIDRCQRAAEDGADIEAFDVSVLKTLYLIRYIDDVKPTIGNISILMIESIDADKIALRRKVADALARLVRQNYVSHAGDTYQFLTNEEQDITREIKNTTVDTANIVDRIKKIIFDDMFTQKKVRVGANDFPFDRYVDESVHGAAQGGMRLDIITLANTLAQSGPEALPLNSTGCALVLLADDGDYFEVLENAAKITKYTQTKSVHHLPESTQAIIRAKQKEANAADRQAREMIERSIIEATVAVDGRLEDVRATNAKDKLEKTLQLLVGAVYTQANLVGAPVKGEEDIIAILRRADRRQEGLAVVGGGNERADSAVESFLEAQAFKHLPTSLGDLQRNFQQVPYGWREEDVSGCVARLAADQRVELFRAGVAIGLDDRNLANYLCRRSEQDKMQVRKREKIDDVLMNRVRKVLCDMELEGTVPDDEDGLVAYAADRLGAKLDWCNAKLADEYTRADYPGRDQVVDAIRVLSDVLGAKGDRVALFNAIAKADDELCDASEDLEAVEGFFPNQQRIYDDALKLTSLMDNPQEQPVSDEQAMGALAKVREVLAMREPYRSISQLGEKIAVVRAAHTKAVTARKALLLDKLAATCDVVREYAEGKPAAAIVVQGLDAAAAIRREQINGAQTLESLDACELQLQRFSDDQHISIDNAEEAAARKADEVSVGTRTNYQTGEKVKTVHLRSVPAALTAPSVKELSRAEVCPARKLTTPEEVEKYVEDIRQQLLAALQDADSVRLR